MKKNTATIILTTVLSISIVTNGCAATASFPGEDAACNPTASENPGETTETPAEAPKSTTAVQGGPYGEISLSIPDGWHYETCPTDSGETDYGLYGIRFYPDGVPQGYIALNYIDNFGVCGTGLATEETTIAGHAASIGTYDNLSHWNFITFRDGYDGIVALTYSVDDWWDACSDQIMEILGTLTFDTSKDQALHISTAGSPRRSRSGCPSHSRISRQPVRRSYFNGTMTMPQQVISAAARIF